ncbi:tyrosine-type recombinase/integrase [uncultured Jatrophihabitans sp.]|uniref:tyrosine-type recombinase/integrase n=1 Tax=uncultured Jatrophihabitans sp. TaxID=1610747 RepID=UPI0035CCA182
MDRLGDDGSEHRYLRRSRQGRVAVGEWSERWLAGQGHLKPSTYSRYAGTVRTHVLPLWRDVPLSDISRAEVLAWVSGLAANRSPSTARKAHRVFSLMLSLAVRDGRLVRNPADGVGLPHEIQRDRRYLTHEQVRELATACGQPVDSVLKRRAGRGHTAADYELVVLFLAYTGVRFGEMAALRVRRIDPLKRRVEIAEAVTSVDGLLVWGTPKGHGRRWVSVPRFVAERLGERVHGLDPDDLAFSTPQGEPLRAGNFRRDVFTPATLRVGLEGLVLHGLRHTAASLAIAAGAGVKVVQQMLGHKSATMTLDLYGPLFDDRLDEVADALDLAARSTRPTRSNVRVMPGVAPLSV